MKREPNWYGLNMLPVYDEMLEGQLDASLGQFNNLKSAEHKPHAPYMTKNTVMYREPHVLNDEIVSRIIKSHTSQNEDIWVYFEQCRKWRNASPTPQELEVITLIEKNAAKLEQVNKDIIALANSFKDKTIDSILSKSDMEVGLEWLLKACSEDSQNK